MQVLKDDYLVYNYNLDNIKNGIVYVIGGRGTGRTTIVKDILIQKRGYPVGRIFIVEDWGQNYYANFCHRNYISVGYNSYLLKEVIVIGMGDLIQLMLQPNTLQVYQRMIFLKRIIFI
jgi:hypothetical protein